MPGLTETGQLEYNGVKFTGAHHVTTELEPVYDDANRAVKAHRITITVAAVLQRDAGMDAELERIRYALNQSGKKLIFRGKGYGNDLQINIGSRGDIDFGPKPEVLEWNPIGDNRAVEITWRVVVTIPPCKTASDKYGIISLTWGAAWSIDEMGDTTRTLSGSMEIWPRSGESVDDYRIWFAPRPVPGFKRSQTWTMAPNHKRIDFQIIDTQIPSPNPYPTRIVAISGTHRFSWRRGKDMLRPHNTISATITPQACQGGGYAWLIFLQIANQRLDYARRTGMSPFLTDLEIEEDLFGRAQSFRISYWFIGPKERFFRTAIEGAGLWNPLATRSGTWRSLPTGGNEFVTGDQLGWETWLGSVWLSWNERGNAGMYDDEQSDKILGLCGEQSPISPNNARNYCLTRKVPPPTLKNETPSPGDSWVEYEQQLIPHRQVPAVRQAHLQSEEPDTGSYDYNADPPTKPYDTGRYASVKSDTIQVGGSGRYGIRLRGRAKRAAYPIPRPTIEKINDEVPVETGHVMRQWEDGTYFGVPVYAAEWAVDFLLKRSPGTIAPPLPRF